MYFLCSYHQVTHYLWYTICICERVCKFFYIHLIPCFKKFNEFQFLLYKKNYFCYFELVKYLIYKILNVLMYYLYKYIYTHRINTYMFYCFNCVLNIENKSTYMYNVIFEDCTTRECNMYARTSLEIIK